MSVALVEETRTALTVEEIADFEAWITELEEADERKFTMGKP
ncbi:hypothetical protein [Kitasatospora sp. NPDC001527]